MSEEEIGRELCEIVASILGRPVSLDTLRSDTPDWDSLKHMEIIFCVEDKWGVTFTEDEIVSVNTMIDLRDQLRERIGV